MENKYKNYIISISFILVLALCISIILMNTMNTVQEIVKEDPVNETPSEIVYNEINKTNEQIVFSDELIGNTNGTTE